MCIVRLWISATAAVSAFATNRWERKKTHTRMREVEKIDVSAFQNLAIMMQLTAFSKQLWHFISHLFRLVVCRRANARNSNGKNYNDPIIFFFPLLYKQIVFTAGSIMLFNCCWQQCNSCKLVWPVGYIFKQWIIRHKVTIEVMAGSYKWWEKKSGIINNITDALHSPILFEQNFVLA